MATERNIIRQIVVCMVSSLVTTYAVIVERCPTDTAERAARAIKICSSIERYHCMLNTEHLFEEGCIDFKQLPPGNYPIYNSFATGNPIDYEICRPDRYQPWPAKSYEITECASAKSACASEGQLLCNTGSKSIDIACQCDSKNGYALTSGKCCNPLGQDDCSCFKMFKNANMEPAVECNCVETDNSSEISNSVANKTDDTFMNARFSNENNDIRYIFDYGNPLFVAVAIITLLQFIVFWIFLRKNKYTIQKYVIIAVLTLVILGCCVLNIFLYKEKVFLKYHLLGISIATLAAVTVCISGIVIVFFFENRKEVYDEDYEVQIFRLLKAAEQGNVDELKSIAQEKYIDMDDVDYDGRNALHVAECAGQVEAVEYILSKHYCNINAKDRKKCSAHDYAKEYKGDNCQDIKELFEKYKDEPQVKTTKKRGKDDITSELINATKRGDIATLKRLKNEGTDMDLSSFDGPTALHVAAESGHTEIVFFLIDECKVSPFTKLQGKRPIDVVPPNNNIDEHTKIREKLKVTMKCLLELKVKLKEQCPEEDVQIVRLLCCAARGDIKRMRLFQRSGYRMDLSNYDKTTALHMAVQNNQEHIVEFLLGKCSLVNTAMTATDRWNETPLMAAKEKSEEAPEVYNAFLKNCQIVDTENEDFRTSRLINAAANGDLVELETLHARKIDMNLRDYDGRTALHLAAAERKFEAVQFLVETAKATVNIPDREGRTPVDESTDPIIKSYLETASNRENLIESQELSANETAMTYIMNKVSKGELHKLQQDKRFIYFSMDSRDYFKNTPLHVASAKARLKDVKYLLDERHVSPFVRNSFSETPLNLVEKKIETWERKEKKAYLMNSQDTRSRKEHFNTVKCKLKEAMDSATTEDVKEDAVFKNHDINERVYLFLSRAYKGDIKSIRRYLKTDKRLITAVNYDRRSALHLAAAEGHYDLVKFMLKKIKDPDKVNAQDRWGKTPLSDAKRIADDKIIQLLSASEKFRYTAEFNDVSEALN